MVTAEQFMHENIMGFRRGPHRPAADICEFCNEIVAEAHRVRPGSTANMRGMWMRSTERLGISGLE